MSHQSSRGCAKCQRCAACTSRGSAGDMPASPPLGTHCWRPNSAYLLNTPITLPPALHLFPKVGLAGYLPFHLLLLSPTLTTQPPHPSHCPHPQPLTPQHVDIHICCVWANLSVLVQHPKHQLQPLPVNAIVQPGGRHAGTLQGGRWRVCVHCSCTFLAHLDLMLLCHDRNSAWSPQLKPGMQATPINAAAADNSCATPLVCVSTVPGPPPAAACCPPAAQSRRS